MRSPKFLPNDQGGAACLTTVSTSFVQAIAADDYADDEQPDLGPLRALAEREEVAGAVSRLGR